jgi:hypothetical protein
MVSQKHRVIAGLVPALSTVMRGLRPAHPRLLCRGQDVAPGAMMATGRFRYLREISNGRAGSGRKKRRASPGNSHNDSHPRCAAAKIIMCQNRSLLAMRHSLSSRPHAPASVLSALPPCERTTLECPSGHPANSATRLKSAFSSIPGARSRSSPPSFDEHLNLRPQQRRHSITPARSRVLGMPRRSACVRRMDVVWGAFEG